MQFKVEDKNFPIPSNPAGYTIKAISATILQIEIGAHTDNIPMYFQFFALKDGVYVEKDSDTGQMPRSINGIDMCGLLSSDPQAIYQAAFVLAAAYQYTLLPIEQQSL